MTAVLYVLKAAIWIWRFSAMYKQSMNVVKGVGLGIAAGAAVSYLLTRLCDRIGN